ncbi:unnamed protein product [Paramecium sonneborni]|uniref:Uncharacterized protein n=1 Tax=Paramecium sonneborni TaxID=65129 RepID=A0A8S1R9F5_9CILI|nr:unnamed protein product [Paramecium sonneborni]
MFQSKKKSIFLFYSEFSYLLQKQHQLIRLKFQTYDNFQMKFINIMKINKEKQCQRCAIVDKV